MEQPDSENPHLPDELLIVRHSGEIPEVALHGSIFFLTRDPNGPGIEITQQELLLLKKETVARYQEIINRDLDSNNRDKSLYRGLARCIINCQRLKRFCQREGLATGSFRKEVALALISLLSKELFDIAANRRVSSINCTRIELGEFIKELGIKSKDLPEGWPAICLADHQNS